MFTAIIGAGLTITFGNWPTGDEIVERRVRLILSSNGTSYPVVFATSGGGSVKKDDNFPSPFNTGTNVNIDFIIEATKLSNRNVVYLKYVGQFV